MILGNFCIGFVIYWFVTWFPSYLVEDRGFDLLQVGIFGAMPALVAIPTGWLGGLVADRLVSRGTSLTTARKVCIVGGLLVSLVAVLTFVTPSAILAVALFVALLRQPHLRQCERLVLAHGPGADPGAQRLTGWAHELRRQRSGRSSLHVCRCSPSTDGRVVRASGADRVRVCAPGCPLLPVCHPPCRAARGEVGPANLRRTRLLSLADTALRRNR
jgi:hypothetical protein